MAPSALIILCTAVAGLLVGAALLISGLRGRRIDDHPLCRRCRFDLVGLPPDTNSCPECGADLRPPRAVRHGRRRSRPALAASGGVIVAAVVALGAAAGWSAATGFDWNTVKPTALLLADLRSPSRGPGAAAELLSRLTAGGVTPERLRRAAATILMVQGDRSRPWDTALGDLFETLRLHGVVTDEQALLYMRQALLPTLIIDDTYEAHTVRPSLRLDRDRVAATPLLDVPLYVSFDGGRLLGPDGPVELPASEWGGVLTTDGRGYGTWSAGWEGRVEVPAGTYPVEMRWTFRYDLGLAHLYTPGTSMVSSISTARPPARTDDPMLRWTETLAAEAEIIGRDVTVFELVSDPALAAGMRGAVTVQRLWVSDGPDEAGRRHLAMFLQVADPPVGIDGYVVLRQNGREWPLRHTRALGWAPRPRLTRSPYPVPVNVTLGVQPGPLEVVIRPDPMAQMWYHEYRALGKPIPLWGEDIAIEAVIPEPASPPAGGTGGDAGAVR